LVISARLFGRTKELETQVDTFFDQLSEAAVIYRLAVRGYLREGITEEFAARLEQVCDKEAEADKLRRGIKLSLYSNLLIPDSRGDVLGLIETADEILSLFKSSLWALDVENPDIHEDLTAGYRRLTNMVVKSVDELAAGCRVFFRSPHLVSSYNAKVTLYEKEADKISNGLKKQIFSAEFALAEKIQLREFVDRIDAIADQAEDVADRLTIYAIKRQN
jgi:uncharacterized protein